MSAAPFYQVGPLTQVAINLFYGWGYNFYRQENQFRTDDLLIRSKVGFLLGSARKTVEAAEAKYRREKLPAPSREKPRHEPEALEGARELERLSRGIGALIALASAQPAPENDRMMQRHRNEAALLQKLIEHDQLLIGQAELLRTTVEKKDGPWLLENAGSVQEGIDAISETLRLRQLLLFPL